MAAEIEKKSGTKPLLEPSSGGAFEIFLDGRLIFSKLKEGRFPEDHEILSKLKR